MAFETQRRPLPRGYDASVGIDAAAMDVGLRQYMLRVYNYMASGLFLSGLVALLVANTGLQSLFFQVNEAGRLGPTGLGYVGILAPIGFILAMSFGAHKMKVSTLQALYWAFVATMGVGLTNILLTYTGVSVVRTLLITAVSYGALSLYGYTTKRDMSGLRTFFFMGLIGLILASVVQMFMQSTMMHFVISAVGVLLFAGLTAYDTQRIKNEYLINRDGTGMDVSAVMGAVALYLNFINLFQFLMMFLGQRRE